MIKKTGIGYYRRSSGFIQPSSFNLGLKGGISAGRADGT
jgi:hypothetical protein